MLRFAWCVYGCWSFSVHAREVSQRESVRITWIWKSKTVDATWCSNLLDGKTLAERIARGMPRFAKSVELWNPTNPKLIVSTMPPSWTRLALSCPYDLAWTLTKHLSTGVLKTCLYNKEAHHTTSRNEEY